jgi:propanol-preferring alcohol dehydrogenase
MILEKPDGILKLADIPVPKPGKGQILIEVHVCGVCRTDLHVLDGELSHPKLPLVMGHQVVGTIVEKGADTQLPIGTRVGVPWLGGSCGHCGFCMAGDENLCDQAVYTGYQADGGFAEYCVARESFCFPLPPRYPDEQVAPLLCAGLIGYRALRLAGEGMRIGFYGFGASAHILTQVVRYQKRQVYAFTRKGDEATQAFARELGVAWAGDSEQTCPVLLDSAIIFASVGPLVPKALQAVRKGGIVVCAGIHMTDIPSFPYSILWGERVLRSVANLTRRDGQEFLKLAPVIPIETVVTPYPLEKANEALSGLRLGKFRGAAVIVVKRREL